MIMAVALTVLLAIIGSAFVLMSRQERQAVRNSDILSIHESALQNVLATIEVKLADAKVGGAVGTIELMSGSDADGIVRTHYDAPDDKHPWLASIEPRVVGTPPVYQWPQISSILPSAGGVMADVRLYPTDVNSMVDTDDNGVVDTPISTLDGLVDADGDGIMDAKLRDLPGFDTNNKRVQAAARIIDNCGLVNPNTVWRGPQVSNIPILRARYNDLNSYGEFGYQIDLARLLARTGVTSTNALKDANSVDTTRLSTQAITPTPLTANSFDLTSIRYQDVMIRDYGWFGLFSSLNLTLPPMPYGLQDEMELRNRFFVNTLANARVEVALSNSIKNYDWAYPTSVGSTNKLGAYRILPYSVPEFVRSYYAQITDDRIQLAPADSNALPWADQRHLLTTHSFDADIRLSNSPSSAADTLLDRPPDFGGPGLGGIGKFRKVNVNTVLRTWFDTTNFTPAQRMAAVTRLAKAFEASGFTVLQGYQFAANLIDFLDADNIPIEFTASMTGLTKDVFGTEKQPVITEVYNEVEALTNEAIHSAVEIYNPTYNNAAINFDVPASQGWELRYGTNTYPLTGSIAPGERIVYLYDTTQPSGLQPSTTSGEKVTIVQSTGLKFEPSSVAPLLLARKAVNPDGTAGTSTVVDSVVVGDMGNLMSPGTHSIWRGLRKPGTTPDALAPWACNRNKFNSGDTPLLGQYNKLTTATDPLNQSGIPIRVDNRGPTTDASTTPATIYWRIHGWYELGRILLVGNPAAPATGSALNPSERTITTTFEDWIPQSTGVSLSYGTGTYSAYPVNEFTGAATSPANWLRLNFADTTGTGTGPTSRLLEHISLSSRTDDGRDNENADGDGSVTTMADTLLECRFPGRINVNTAPESVLRAIFPALIDPTVIANLDLSDEELEALSRWYARAIVHLRSTSGAFKSLPDLLNRLNGFRNPQVTVGTRTAPVLTFATPPSSWNQSYSLPKSMQQVPEYTALPPLLQSANVSMLSFGFLVDWMRSRPLGTTQVGTALYNTGVADPTQPINPLQPPAEVSLHLDSEERDWIFTRMANLLTVRSDTFTAYILVRVSDRLNPGDYTDRRYMATIDRSNVFLPQWAAVNGNFRLANGTTKDFSTANLAANYVDDSGEMARYGFGGTPAVPLYVPGGTGSLYPNGTDDPDHFDRQYVLPKIVALQQVPDPK